MAGTLPGIVIKLSADTKDAIQGLNRVKNALGETATKGDKFNAAMPAVGAAIAAAGAAAAAAAIKFGVDGVNAFKQDQVAAASLATTLENLGFAHDTARVERFIDSMQRETGVADDELRPAFDRLVRSTNNVGEAQKLLTLAMDVSAGINKTLQQTVEALSRAHDGSTTALSKLGTGLTAAELKAMSFDQVAAKLGDTFEGQTATKAGTLQGALDRLSVGFGELKESFGRGFVGAVGDSTDATNDLMDAMKELEPVVEDIGSAIGSTTKVLSYFIGEMSRGKKIIDSWPEPAKSGFWSFIQTSFGGLIKPAASIKQSIDNLQDLAGAVSDTRQQAEWTTPQINALARGYATLADMVNMARDATEGYDIRKGLNAWTQRYTALARKENKPISFTGGNLKAWLAARNDDGDGNGNGGPQETFAERWRKAFDTSKQAFDSWYDKTLGALRGKLDNAKQAVDAWVTNMRSALTSGLNLGDAFQQQLDDVAQRADLDGAIAEAIAKGDMEGKARLEAQKAAMGAAVSWIDKFNEQIAQAEWFGNVLNEAKRQLDASGTESQGFIQHLASLGPAVGGALAQQMIDNGLIPEMAAKWNGAQTKMQELTDTLIPAALKSAQASTQATVDQFEQFFGKGGDGRKRIFELMDDLATKAARTVKIDVDVTKRTTEIISKVYGGKDGDPATPMATGGIVTRPTFAMIGEAGPEAVIPLSRGASYGVGGGSTVNITVQAGVGDPAAIGRTVVESIRAYERRSGKVFAAA